MTIGIDIDDTISKTTKTLRSLSNMDDELFNRVIEHPKDYPDIKNLLENTFRNMDVYDNSINVINYFKDKGHRIVIITARGKNIDDFIPITNDFLKNKKINIDKVIYCQERKGNSCISEGVDIFIDDNEIVLDEVASKGIKTIRFSEDDIESNHLVLHNWMEIKNYIDGMGES